MRAQFGHGRKYRRAINQGGNPKRCRRRGDLNAVLQLTPEGDRGGVGSGGEFTCGDDLAQAAARDR